MRDGSENRYSGPPGRKFLMSVGLISPIVHDIKLVALLVDANGLSDALEARFPTWSSRDSKRREHRYLGSTMHPNPLPLFFSLIPFVKLALVPELPLGFEPLHRVELGRLRRPALLELEAHVGNMLLLGGGRDVLREQVRAVLCAGGLDQWNNVLQPYD